MQVSGILPFVYAMEKFLEYAQENASGVKTIVSDLKEDFGKQFLKYKENKDLKIAMMMDPRFKLKYIDESEQSIMRELLCTEYYFFYTEALSQSRVSDIESDPDALVSAGTSRSSNDSDGSDSPSRK